MREDVTIEDAGEGDLPAITNLLNHAVRETTAVWYDRERTPEQMAAWFAERRAGGFPVLVAWLDGAVLGYASYGPFRPHDGYALTAEHSIYVAPGHQGRGIGSALLTTLIARARAQGLHVLVGGLEADNAASLALHARHGFIETGRLPQTGRKFGRWLTLVLVQKVLDAREAP